MENGRSLLVRLLTDPFWVTGAVFLGLYLLIGIQDRVEKMDHPSGNAVIEPERPLPAVRPLDIPRVGAEMRS